MNNEPNFDPSASQETKESPAKRCPVCGKDAAPQASFCGECGHSFGTGTTPFTTPTQAVLPEDAAPLKTSDYLLMMLVTSLPFVGFILLLIWSFASDTNVNRRNFSRAYLIATVIVGGIAMLFCIGIFALGMSLAYSEAYAVILPFIFR